MLHKYRLLSHIKGWPSGFERGDIKALVTTIQPSQALEIIPNSFTASSTMGYTPRHAPTLSLDKCRLFPYVLSGTDIKLSSFYAEKCHESYGKIRIPIPKAYVNQDHPQASKSCECHSASSPRYVLVDTDYDREYEVYRNRLTIGSERSKVHKAPQRDNTTSVADSSGVPYNFTEQASFSVLYV